MPLNMEATEGLSRSGELDVRRENSSGSSSWLKIASNSLVAVIVASAFFASHSNVPRMWGFLMRQHVRPWTDPPAMKKRVRWNFFMEQGFDIGR
jgi:hypothetical protein